MNELLILIKGKMQYINIYWLIVLVGSNLLYALGAELVGVISIVLAILSIIVGHLSATFDRKFMMMSTLFIVLSVLTVNFTSGQLSLGTILGVFSKMLIVYVTLTLDIKMFAERFVKIVFVLASISIILWLIYIVGGEGIARLICKGLYYNPNENFYGLFAIGYNFAIQGLPRNAYIFGEPGKYQIILNVALYFLMFYCDELDSKTKKIVFYTLIFAIVTAQSTEGYFIMFALMLAYFFYGNRERHFVAAILVSVIAVVVYTLFFAGDINPFQTTITAKVFNEAGEFSLNQNTGAARMAGLDAYPDFVGEHPVAALIGVGAGDNKYGIQFGGLIGFFFIFGIVSGIIVHGYMILEKLLYGKTRLMSGLAIAMLVFHGLSQPDYLSSVVCAMLLYDSYIVRYHGYEEFYN